MRTWYSTASLKGGAPTYIDSSATTALDHCDYLSNLNYKLVVQNKIYIELSQ